MPSFQTKALVVMPISGDYFLEVSHPIVWLLGHVCSDKAEFSCKRKPLFDAFSNVHQTDVWSVRCIRRHSHCEE